MFENYKKYFFSAIFLVSVLLVIFIFLPLKTGATDIEDLQCCLSSIPEEQDGPLIGSCYPLKSGEECKKDREVCVSKSGGLGEPPLGCDYLGTDKDTKLYGTYSQVSCIKKIACVNEKDIAAFKKDSITWTGPENTSVEMGKSIKVDVSASAKSPYQGPVKIKCVNCDDIAGTDTAGDNDNGQMSLTLDTADYTKETGQFPPPSINIKYTLMGETADGKINIFSTGITILAFNCEQYQISNDCVTKNPVVCFWWGAEDKCAARNDTKICHKLPQDLCGTANGSTVCVWNETQKKCFTPLEAGITKEYGVPEGYVGALPPCAFSGTCDDVNDLIQVLVNFGKGMFAIIGSFVFAFFVYGGLTIIMSFGNAEKVKKGKDIMVAAVVGLAIVFLAYIAINFLLEAVGVKETFKAIQ